MLAGISDWADGKIARALDQRSQLGTLLDPAADRLYIVATLVALALRDIVPLWLVAVLVGRELVLGGVLLVLRLAHGENPVAPVAAPLAWALTIWGTVLYLVAGALYVIQAVGLVRAARSSAAAGTAS